MKQENSAFISFGEQTEGIIFDDSSNPKYPIRYYNVINGNGVKIIPENSYFGYVYSGVVVIKRSGLPIQYLSKGQYFSLSGQFWIVEHITNGEDVVEVDGKAIVIEVVNAGYYKETNYKAYATFGGPIEATGRLKYIDGCTDSLLIPPVKKGAPCLNHLHFPNSIDQTQHTHPSHRIGIVASGYGECITPFGNLPLTESMIFVIKQWDGEEFSKGLDGEAYPNGQHAFKTFEDVMNVIAFHPDSDFGPEDEFHPMINRTIVNGISANQIQEIRTK